MLKILIYITLKLFFCFSCNLSFSAIRKMTPPQKDLTKALSLLGWVSLVEALCFSLPLEHRKIT